MLKVLLVGNGYAFILYWLYSHPSKIVKSKFPLCIIKKPRNMSERNSMRGRWRVTNLTARQWFQKCYFIKTMSFCKSYQTSCLIIKCLYWSECRQNACVAIIWLFCYPSCFFRVKGLCWSAELFFFINNPACYMC